MRKDVIKCDEGCDKTLPKTFQTEKSQEINTSESNNEGWDKTLPDTVQEKMSQETDTSESNLGSDNVCDDSVAREIVITDSPVSDKAIL